MIKITKEFLEEHAQKMSVSQMARTYGLSEHTIRRKEVEFGTNRSQYKDIQLAIKHMASKKNTADWTNLKDLNEIGAYWLGMFYADASLFLCKSNQMPRFSIGLKLSDKYILEQCIEDFKLTNKLIDRKPHTSLRNGKTIKSNGSSHLTICDIELVSILCSYGMEPGPNYKRDPPAVYYMLDFLRGYMDGDGWIHITPNKPGKMRRFGLRWCCTYNEMAIKLQCILKSMGFESHIWPTHGIWTLAVDGKYADDLAAKMWHNPKRFLKRKYDRYLEWLEYRKANPPYYDTIKDRNAKIHARIAEGAKATDIMREFNLSKTQTYAVLKTNIQPVSPAL